MLKSASNLLKNMSARRDSVWSVGALYGIKNAQIAVRRNDFYARLFKT